MYFKEREEGLRQSKEDTFASSVQRLKQQQVLMIYTLLRMYRQSPTLYIPTLRPMPSHFYLTPSQQWCKTIPY